MRRGHELCKRCAVSDPKEGQEGAGLPWMPWAYGSNSLSHVTLFGDPSYRLGGGVSMETDRGAGKMAQVPDEGDLGRHRWVTRVAHAQVPRALTRGIVSRPLPQGIMSWDTRAERIHLEQGDMGKWRVVTWSEADGSAGAPGEPTNGGAWSGSRRPRREECHMDSSREVGKGPRTKGTTERAGPGSPTTLGKRI